MKEKLKSIEHRFSTHQVQEIMKKEEKGKYYIFLNFTLTKLGISTNLSREYDDAAFLSREGTFVPISFGPQARFY